MATLLLDDNGKPIPQYKNAAGTAFEALRGANGGMDVNVLEAAAIAAGENIIGKVRVIDSNGIAKNVSNITKAIQVFTPNTPTALWVPAEGKKIVLKGLIIQCGVLLEGSAEEGPSNEDTVLVGVFYTGMNPVAVYTTSAKQFLQGDPYGVPNAIVGKYEREIFNYGDGIILDTDIPLAAFSSHADVSVVAWGYEV